MTRLPIRAKLVAGGLALSCVSVPLPQGGAGRASSERSEEMTASSPASPRQVGAQPARAILIRS
jgi:hypothetical protein